MTQAERQCALPQWLRFALNQVALGNLMMSCQSFVSKSLRVGALALAVAAPSLFGPVNVHAGNVTFYEGNQQYTNVNIASDTNANTVYGEVGNTGVSVAFKGYYPDTSTSIPLHGQHGVAFIEPDPKGAHMTAMSVTIQSGYYISAMDWNLEASGNTDGHVWFVPKDAQGHGIPYTPTSHFLFDAQGQNKFHMVADPGTQVSSVWIYSDIDIDHLKQVSMEANHAVPEPSTFALLGVAGIAVAIGARRRKRLSVADATQAQS